MSHAVLTAALAQLGHSAMRPGQAEVIAEVLRGTPVIAVMPTGAGKSLCYQLPAVIMGSRGEVTLVVSPLIALMKDQVDAMVARGIAAASLTSAASPDEQRETFRRLLGGELTLLYVAPERFRSPRFMDALAELGEKLALIAIDEAHCISEWGHDFRPDYRRLADVVKQLRPTRLAAFTATATPEVRDDIAAQLGVTAPTVFVKGFDRPNLHFTVEPVSGSAAKVARLFDLIRKRDGGVALVYAATRKNAETYASALTKRGLRARVYHAGLGDTVREKNQDTFMAGKLDVIVATNAFGMGVDKSDIRLVLHADVPRSPEAYYQEAGRGGRDGAPTQCVLLFSHADVRLHEYLIAASSPTADILRGAWKALRDASQVPGPRLEQFFIDEVADVTGAMAATISRVLERHDLMAIDADGHARATRPGPNSVPLDAEGLARRALVERGKLRVMVQFATSTACRRHFLLRYFGDSEWTSRTGGCGACDVCDAIANGRAVTGVAEPRLLPLLELIGALGGRFGRKRVAALACGDADSDAFDDLPGYGECTDEGTDGVMAWLRALESAGYIEASRGEYPTISLTPAGQTALDTQTPPELTLLSGAAAASSRAKRNRRAAHGSRGGRASGAARGVRRRPAARAGF